MRCILISLVVLLYLLPIHLRAQLLRTAKDSAALHNNIRFPEASANMVISFNTGMLELDRMPEAKQKKQPLNVLLEQYEADGGDSNIELMIDIYNAYYDEGKSETGFKYLQRAYNLAIEVYDANPSNIEVIEQITEMMLIVGRLQDIPALWFAYSERNPEVAKGWAKLALYEVQTLKLEAAQQHLKIAYSKDPALADIYVTACLMTVYQLMIGLNAHSEEDSTAPDFSMDLSFLQQAAAEHPELEVTEMSLKLLESLEIFYMVMLENVDKFSEERSFKLAITEKQQLKIEAISAYMQKALKKEEIVNKFLPLKAMLLLEVLQGNMEMAAAYLESSKKYIEKDVDLYKLIAYGYLPLRKYHKAIPFLEKAIALSPSFDDQFALCRLYFENYQYEEAMQLIQQLMLSQPNRPELIYGLVSIYLRQGKYDYAQSTLERFTELYADEINFEEDDYYLFYKAVHLLCSSKDKAEVKRALQAVVDQDLPWAKEAKSLINAFF